MAFLGFGKKKGSGAPCCDKREEKKESCACGGGCDSSGAQPPRFLVLGACCKKSADTFANVKQAVAELGLSDEVRNSGDSLEIAKYGVMQTPALVIDSKVVSYGKLISVEEGKRLIERAGVQA